MSSVSSPVSMTTTTTTATTMTTPESDAGSLAPASPAVDGRDCYYRAMIRHLLVRYTRHEIEQLLEEEGCEAAPYGLAYSSQNNGSSNSNGNNNNGTDNSNSSALATLPAGIQCADRSPGPGAAPALPVTAAAKPVPRPRPRPGGGASSAYRTDYACGFCAEMGIAKTCTRRNDLRRHIDQFHNTNAQWLCQHPGCRMAFDWQTAYQIHLRNEHGGSQMRMDEAKVVLCPQTVFACGYEGCHHVFEAAGDAAAPPTWRAYTSHLIRHCDEGRDRRWDYSHRLRNLLRQSRVAAAWGAADAARRRRLRWDPVSSRTLRRLLETRHVDSLPHLIGCAVVLGSAPDARPEQPLDIDDAKLDLHLPVKKLCPAAATKHELRDHSDTSPVVEEPRHARLYGKLSSGPEYPGVPEGPQSQSRLAAVPPFRPAATPGGYGGYGGNPQAADTPMTPPQVFYGMPGPAVYQAPAQQQQQHADLFAVSPIHAAASEPSVLLRLDEDTAAVPRGHQHQHDRWADVYGSTGLQSPALTDTYYGLGAAPQNILGTYGEPGPS